MAGIAQTTIRDALRDFSENVAGFDASSLAIPTHCGGDFVTTFGDSAGFDGLVSVKAEIGFCNSRTTAPASPMSKVPESRRLFNGQMISLSDSPCPCSQSSTCFYMLRRAFITSQSLARRVEVIADLVRNGYVRSYCIIDLHVLVSWPELRVKVHGMCISF